MKCLLCTLEWKFIHLKGFFKRRQVELCRFCTFLNFGPASWAEFENMQNLHKSTWRHRNERLIIASNIILTHRDPNFASKRWQHLLFTKLFFTFQHETPCSLSPSLLDLIVMMMVIENLFTQPVARDIHIECSKQFKWNSYFYVSGQSQPFWAPLKLP